MPALSQKPIEDFWWLSLHFVANHPTRTGYASKHAMQGFFDTLRIELRGSGVDVLVVSPGFVATDIRQGL